MKMAMRGFGMLLLASLVTMSGGAQAATVTYGFGCISPNRVLACTAGEAQFSVDIADEQRGQALAGQVLFTFRNAGPLASITDIYFDDGTLLGIASVVNGPGVRFSQNATPPILPGGNTLTPPFQVTQGFSADSDPPVPQNGVNAGEQLGILFDLKAGGSFAAILDELNGVVTENGAPKLRIGIHAQSFSDGSSASFVNGSPVPLPAAGWLLLAGIGALGWLGRRRAVQIR